MRTLLTADFVIACENGGHVILQRGEVVFEGSTIVFVGHGFPGHVDRRHGYGHAIIGPGFIDLDALGDLDTTILSFDNGPERELGRVWSERYLRAGPTDAYAPDEELLKYRYAFTQMIRNGITTAMPITSMLYRAWAENYEEFAGVAVVAGEMGLRAYLGPCYMSGVTYLRDNGTLSQHFDEPRGLTGLADAIRFIGDFDGSHGGRLRGFLAPDRIETQTADVLRRTAGASRELNVPVRLHCCQSTYEVETVQNLHGKSPYAWLAELGLLNRRAILPHGIYLNGDDDLLRLQQSGASIVHCPVVFARFGETLKSFSRYRDLGINLALGTDTFPPDIVMNMREGLNICHVMDGARWATAADFYTAATLGGAGALGRDDLGRLAVGAKADITVFDLSGFHLGQFTDPIKTMVIGGSGRDFLASYIDGVAVMENGQVRGADYPSLRAGANQQFRKAMEFHVRQAGKTGPPDQLFKPSFPTRRPPP